MSADLAVTVSLSGLVGSLAAIGATYGFKRHKEMTLRKNARALVKNELTKVRNHIQYLANSTTTDKNIPLLFGSTSVVVGETLIDALDYPHFNTEIKLLAFDTEELTELQNVYTLIKSTSAYRIRVSPLEFEYTRADLRRWLEEIDKVIQKIDPPKTDQTHNLTNQP